MMYDLWIVPVSKEEEAYPFTTTPYEEYNGVFSPDGRWIAYTSDETGTDQVYVTPFPGPGSKWQVSTDDGDLPQWREDGKELYYLNGKDEIMAAEVNGSTSTFQIGQVKKLFSINAARPGTIYQNSRDGQQFIVNSVLSKSDKSKVVLVKNWDQDIEK